MTLDLITKTFADVGFFGVVINNSANSAWLNWLGISHVNIERTETFNFIQLTFLKDTEFGVSKIAKLLLLKVFLMANIVDYLSDDKSQKNKKRKNLTVIILTIRLWQLGSTVMSVRQPVQLELSC